MKPKIMREEVLDMSAPPTSINQMPGWFWNRLGKIARGMGYKYYLTDEDPSYPVYDALTNKPVCTILDIEDKEDKRQLPFRRDVVIIKAESDMVINHKDACSIARQCGARYISYRDTDWAAVYETERADSEVPLCNLGDCRTETTEPAKPKPLPPISTRSVRKFANSIEFCYCPAGSFKMGEGDEQVGVTLTNGFWLGRTVVTQGQWQALMQTEPWIEKHNVEQGRKYPATYVSWDDAMEFCKRLTERGRAIYRSSADWEYTLPTEAQWEYACRAGTTTRYSFGDDWSDLFDYAWFDGNAFDVGEYCAHEVGQKSANPWGLYDMHGNVWEWCRDWYKDSLPGGTDPEVKTTAEERVQRGGCWFATAGGCRSAVRSGGTPDDRLNFLGFRLALVKKKG